MRELLTKIFFTVGCFVATFGLLAFFKIAGVSINMWVALFPAVIWAHWFYQYSEVRHYRSSCISMPMWAVQQVVILIYAFVFSGYAYNVSQPDNTWWLGVAVLPFILCPLYVRVFEGEQFHYPLFWKDIKFTTIKMWNWYTPFHLAIMVGLLYLSTRSLVHIPYMERIESEQLQFVFKLFYLVVGSMPFWMPYLASEMEPEPMFPREPEEMTRGSRSYV